MNKKTSLFIFIIVFLGIMISILIICKHGKADSEDIIQTTSQNLEAVNKEARIPKRKEGVNIYELENAVFDVVGAESVMISTNRSSGSGILWQGSKKEIVILTTAHLLSDFETGEAELWNAEKISFTKDDVIKQEIQDLAVIQISLDEALKHTYSGVSAFTSSKPLKIGDSMWIIDSIYGAGSGISTAQAATENIYLEDYQAIMYLLYGEGKAGMSGSPVYNEDGYLVGMVSGMSDDKSTLAVVLLEAITNFIQTLN